MDDVLFSFQEIKYILTTNWQFGFAYNVNIYYFPPYDWFGSRELNNGH
jgi:hypothetical protein